MSAVRPWARTGLVCAKECGRAAVRSCGILGAPSLAGLSFPIWKVQREGDEGSVLHQDSVSLREHWQCLQTFLVVTTEWWVLLASSGWRPGMLVNIHSAQDRSPWYSYPARVSIGLQWRNLGWEELNVSSGFNNTSPE